jgi:cysteine desulfurase
LPNTTALLVPDVDGDALRLAIDQADIAVGFGAACSALTPEPSPSLMALGLSAAETRRVVRLSLPIDISGDDVTRAAVALRAVLTGPIKPRGA